MFVRRLKIELGLWFLAQTGITTLVRTDIWAKQSGASQIKSNCCRKEVNQALKSWREKNALLIRDWTVTTGHRKCA